MKSIVLIVFIGTATHHAKANTSLDLIKSETSVHFLNGDILSFQTGFFFLNQDYTFSIITDATLLFLVDENSVDMGLLIHNESGTFNNSLLKSGVIKLIPDDYFLNISSNFADSIPELSGSFTITPIPIPIPIPIPLPGTLWLLSSAFLGLISIKVISKI